MLFNRECSISTKQGEFDSLTKTLFTFKPLADLLSASYETSSFGPSTTTLFTFKPLADLLIASCGTGSFVKRIPDFAFTAPNNFKAGLIQGYFDVVGNIKCEKFCKQIHTSSISKQLIKDLALILNYFDIFGNINEENFNGKANYNLNISPNYASLYLEKIGSFVHFEKLTNMIEFVERDNKKFLNEEIDKINGLGDIISKCGKELQILRHINTYKFWKHQQSIGRITLEKYISIFDNHPDSYKIASEIAILKQAVNSNVIWDEIINIELYTLDQKNYVYDFTIPSNQTFMTDYGVIVHNTLNTFHFAGVAAKSNVTRGVPRIEEILSLSSEPKNPSLTLYLKKEEETDKDKAHSIMYMLEHTTLQEFVESIEVCFDPDDLNTMIDEDKSTMEQYRSFERMVDECANVSMTEDTNEKSKWIIRMIMDKTTMLEKNINMDDVSYTLNNSYGDEVSCVFSDYNADKLVFRVRMNNIMKQNSSRSGQKKKVNPLDQSDQIYILKNFQDQLLQNIVLRGIKGINKVIMRKIKDNVVETSGIFKKQDIWVLDTVGTNMMSILALDYIDANRTISNDIVEVFNVLGIEAARQTIYNELVEVIEFDGTYINSHHFSILCDRMTFTNKMISIFRHGINNDNIGPIAKASFEETPEMFLKAARHAELDTMRGISANVMCGQEGFYGTSAFQVVLDINEMKKLEELIQYEQPDEEAEIEKMFGGIESPDDTCGTSKLTIQNNVISIVATNLGTDNDYNPGF